jgi:hypothetical protein
MLTLASLTPTDETRPLSPLHISAQNELLVTAYFDGAMCSYECELLLHIGAHDITN